MRGFYISLVGSDGTGKSSISQLLEKRLKAQYNKVSLFYMGSLNNVLFTSRIISKLSVRNKKKNSFKQANIAKPKNLRFGLVSFIKELTFLHSIIELFARYFIWIRPRVKNGEVVITDRYIYDFLIVDRFLNKHRWFREFVIRIIPAPDLLICLYNDPDIILKRKKDNSQEETLRQNQIFLSLGQYVKTFKKLKTDGTIEEIADNIFKEIVKTVAIRKT